MVTKRTFREDEGGDQVQVKRACRICSVEGCTNGAVRGGVCFRHGAERKKCSHEGCANLSVKEGVCVRHGAKRKKCSHEGCANQAKTGGVCIRHGAKVQVKRVKLCITKDAPIKSSVVVYAREMAQNKHLKLAGMKDAPTRLNKEESA